MSLRRCAKRCLTCSLLWSWNLTSARRRWSLQSVVSLGVCCCRLRSIQMRWRTPFLLAMPLRMVSPWLTVGCFIANMLGPNGIMDVIFGTIATFISVLAVYYTPKVIRNSKTALIIASLWPTIINGLIIGVMLSYLYALPLILTIFQVALGEFVVVTILGVPFINFIKPYMKKIIPNL